MKTYLPYIVIVVLLFALFFSWTNRKEVQKVVVESDTTTLVVFDTIIEKLPIFITERIVDTIYVGKDENIPLLLTQKRYTTDDYDIWVSGYRPNLDSAYIFRKTEYQTITNTITKEIYPKTTDLFVKAGVDVIGGKFSPNLGFGVKFKRGIYVDAKVGYYDKGVAYGASIGYKFN